MGIQGDTSLLHTWGLRRGRSETPCITSTAWGFVYAKYVKPEALNLNHGTSFSDRWRPFRGPSLLRFRF